MKIRLRLILYFGLLLTCCFGIAAILTVSFLDDAVDRLIYSNVLEMNETIADSLDTSSRGDLFETLETVRSVTGVEMIVYDGDLPVYSTFPEGPINLAEAKAASDKYNVYHIVYGGENYYYTSEYISMSDYQVLIFRGEDLALEDDRLYYASFVGLIFLIFSVTAFSIFTTRSFTNPIRHLAEYANGLNPDVKPAERPKFGVLEFNELGTALEKASIRLYAYHQSEQEFLHNFSHEMKTPLTNIYGYAEAMRYHVLTEEESKNACHVIMDESLRLKDTINQILLLGRLGSVQEILNMQKTNLVDILNDALNNVQIVAKEAGIRLEFANSDEDHYLQADPEKMETAFVNILSNGVRYAKSAVRISILNVADSLTVLIDDDGPGIPPEEREKVFERYYTGYKGHTGLGLTITQAIIHKHKATIAIEEGPDHGARFRIVFPGKNQPEKNSRSESEAKSDRKKSR